jgi:hypothetical protein
VTCTERTYRRYYGADDVEVFLFEFTTLEFQAAHRTKVCFVLAFLAGSSKCVGMPFVQHALLTSEDEDMGPICLSKLVCVKSLDMRVVGFHFVGPNAGEITQVRKYSYKVPFSCAHLRFVGIRSSFEARCQEERLRLPRRHTPH